MEFANRIAKWHELHGRHDLPWQGTKDPYRIWISEIMLQQTQVATVIPYYENFLKRFPNIQELACSNQEEVMFQWTGLGYYTRALNLHRCAKELVSFWNGKFPSNSKEINLLPGIGRSTAAAIAAFAYQEHSPIMDGNVKRVFARHFSISEDLYKASTIRKLWGLAEQKIQESNNLSIISYTQGLIDLGATLCKPRNPECFRCPISTTCIANSQEKQHELPKSREKRELPNRKIGMLVIRTEDFLFLLEKKPDSGIWSALWSLPEFDSTESPLSKVRDLGLIVKEHYELKGFIHRLSHYRLHIQPIYINISAPEKQLINSKRRFLWIKKTQLSSVAIPSPVKKILNTLCE